MSKVIDVFRKHLRELDDHLDEEKDNSLKAMNFRVTRELFDEIEDVASVLQLNKSEFLRMLVENAIKDIKLEFQINVERNGMTPSEIDDFINLPEEEKQKFLEGLGIEYEKEGN